MEVLKPDHARVAARGAQALPRGLTWRCPARRCPGHAAGAGRGSRVAEHNAISPSYPVPPGPRPPCSCGWALLAPAGLCGDQTRLNALEEHKAFLGHCAPNLQGSCKMSVIFFSYFIVFVWARGSCKVGNKY